MCCSQANIIFRFFFSSCFAGSIRQACLLNRQLNNQFGCICRQKTRDAFFPTGRKVHVQLTNCRLILISYLLETHSGTHTWMSGKQSLTWGAGGRETQRMMCSEEVRCLSREMSPVHRGSCRGHSSQCPQEQKATWEGGMFSVPRILLEWLSLFKLEYCRLIVDSERKMMSRGPVLHGFSVFE